MYDTNCTGAGDADAPPNLNFSCSRSSADVGRFSPFLYYYTILNKQTSQKTFRKKDFRLGARGRLACAVCSVCVCVWLCVSPPCASRVSKAPPCKGAHTRLGCRGGTTLCCAVAVALIGVEAHATGHKEGLSHQAEHLKEQADNCTAW